MKKLVVMTAIIVAALVSNAASFKWVATNIYGSDGATKWSGSVSLYAEGISEAVYTTTASAGTINTTFTSSALEGGSTYNMYFVIEDNGQQFTSGMKEVKAQATTTANIGFGNMATATQNASNWANVPEPTSAMLMILGIAGLALRRRRV